jgi:hypothetical protein
MFQIAASVSYALDHQCEFRFPLLHKALNGELNYRFVFHRLSTSQFPENLEFYHYNQYKYALSDEYIPILYESNRNICLDGYYLNEKYFSKHADFIRQLFAPTEEISVEIHRKYGEILKNPTVAIHVRTFLLEGIDPDIGGFTKGDWTYYINAMSFFPDDYTFLIFTDYPDWTKRNFPRIRQNMHFIEGNPHYFDFYLMSSCQHQVVSPRSTFSWWAAWLNPNPNKVVIAPDYMCESIAAPNSWIREKLR